MTFTIGVLALAVAVGVQAPDVAQLRQAAETGDVRAMEKLGALYTTGEGGIAPDDAEGVRWYTRAATSGSKQAQYTLGLFYTSGLHGLAASKAVGVEWFRRAALQRDDDAMYALGVAYLKGEGVARDPLEAYQWIWLSKDHVAESRRAEAAATFAALEKQLTPRQRIDALEGVKAFLEHREKKEPAAAAGAGRSAGGAAPAIADLQQRAERGDSDAMYRLAVAYRDGAGVVRSEIDAIAWMMVDVLLSGPAAAGKYASFSAVEKRVNQSAQAMAGARVSADMARVAGSGHVKAQLTYATILAQGAPQIGIGKDLVEAHKWLDIVAKTASGAEQQAAAAAARNQVALQMTPQQINEAQARARVWIQNRRQ